MRKTFRHFKKSKIIKDIDDYCRSEKNVKTPSKL